MAQQSHILAAQFSRKHSSLFLATDYRVRIGSVCYNFGMTKLLDEAFDRLRELPEEMQESAARSIMRTLEEEPEPGDIDAIQEARREFANGEFSTHDQWKHEMGIGNR
jgi:hypothetical protein